ncbi:carbon-nitrogen hydrolase family protein [Sporobolomyces salmoneus]|uniref:carbon-nitrogen hydrolase family protein n=1 Tax=Sporobolomyces salmoneus TaxID=183962 RepID=UPI0031712150
MTSKTYVAVGQLCSTEDPAHNALLACSIIRRAAALSAKLVMLPEGCDFIATPEEIREKSKPIEEHDFLNKVRKQAKESKCWVAVGIHEASDEKDRVYNTNVLIDDQGNIASKYEKIHLLDVDVQGGDSTKESELIKAGERLADPVQTPAGKLGLLICYDLRFPEAARALRKKGASLIGYNSAWTQRTGPPHWEVLLRARAIENQAFVLASNQVGTHPSGRQSYGHAMIISPWGDVLAQCADRPPADPKEQKEDDGDFCMTAIDPEWAEELRESMPLFDQRRTDIYGDI